MKHMFLFITLVTSVIICYGREQKEKEQFNHCVEENVNQQNLEICEEEKRHHLQAKYRQKLIMERLQELQTKEALDNLKVCSF